MTRIIQEPISSVSLTSSVLPYVQQFVESIRRDADQLSIKELKERSAEAGFTMKIPTGLTAKAARREFVQLTNVLLNLPENAQQTLLGFGGLPNDLMHNPGTRNARNRYDLGVVVEEKKNQVRGNESRRMTGLVFNAVFPRPILPWERHARGGPDLERNIKGGFNVDFGAPVVVGEPSFRGETRSIRQIIQEKCNAGVFTSNVAERLAALVKQGYNLSAQRSIMEVSLSDGSTQLAFFKLAGERAKGPLTKDEVQTAKRLGYDLTEYLKLKKTDPDYASKVEETTAHLPRDYGIGFVDSCVEFGDLLGGRPILARRPVISIYHPVPGTAVEVSVALESSAYFSCVYPKAIERQGDEKVTWRMKSGGLSGELFDPSTEKRYPYLYWEAVQGGSWKIDRTKAFCVSGDDAAQFLESACEAFAFNAKETTDFVTYWLPSMERNEYNVIQFVDPVAYDRFAHMEISPTPDQVTRVFMIFERSSVPVQTGAPALDQVTRHAGFVVTEWGGSNLDETRSVVR